MRKVPDAIPADVREVGPVLQRHAGCEVRSVTLADGSPAILKRLDRDVARSLDGVSRFRREVRIHRTVRAPGVPRVLAANDAGDGPFLLLERVPGPTLAEFLERDAPVEVVTGESAAAFGATVARTLAELHALGVVHRDLSATNLILREGELAQPVLLDFGLARHEDESTLTMEGDVLGTLRYAAPEQVTGTRLLPPGPEADVFALGMLLYEILEGRPARRGQNRAELLREIVLVDVPLPSTGGDSRGALRRLVGRMTSRDPRRRPTAADCRRNLEAVAARRPARVAPLPPFTRVRRSWRGLPPGRRRASLAAGAALLLLTVAGLRWWDRAPRRWVAEARLAGSTTRAASLLLSAWERDPRPEIALQRGLVHVANGDAEAARQALVDLSGIPDWESVAEGLVAWFDAANRDGPVLAGGWNRPETDPEGLAWAVRALSEGVEAHPDRPWLLAWRALVSLSYYEQIGALQDLAAAKALAPEALLLQRFDFLARMRFGFSERLFPVLREARSTTADAPEWDLWEALLRERRGERARAQELLERAATHLPAGEPLAARVVMELHALRGSAPPPSPPSVADPLTRIAWARARLLAGASLGEPSDPECWISLELPPNRVREVWSDLLRADSDAPGRAAATAPSPVFRPDLRTRDAAERAFDLLGDRERILFDGSGTVTLVPDEDSTGDPGGQAPSLVTRSDVFPDGDWELTAEVRWVGTGDFGVGIHAPPITVECDVGIRVRIGTAARLLPADERWHRLQVTRRGARHAVTLDGETVLAVDDPEIGTPAKILLGVWSPWFSPRFECRALEVRGL